MRKLFLLTLMTWMVSNTTYAETITIKKGDTLWALSLKHLGNPWLWPCFKDVNFFLQDEKKMEVGDQVNVPEVSQCTKYQSLQPKSSQYPASKNVAKKPSSNQSKKPSIKANQSTPYYISTEADDVFVYSNGEIKMVSRKLLHTLINNSQKEVKAKELINGTVFDRALMKELLPKDPRKKDLL